MNEELRKRPRLVYGEGPWAPSVDPATVADLAGIGDDVDVLLGWTIEELPWVESMPPGRVTTMNGGYRLAKAVTAGVATVRSTRLSTLPGRLAGEWLPDVAVVSGRPSGTGFVFGANVGW